MAVESFGDIHALPEDCIANALSLTSPKDACRLSAVASTFRSASQSDVVWGRFLPSDYRDLIAGAVDGPDALLSKFRSKKDLYLHLCDNPILIDGGRKSFSLEKHSGKKCYMIAARDLYIVWSDTPQYWQWVYLPESSAHGFENHPAEAFVGLTGQASQRCRVFIDPDGAHRERRQIVPRNLGSAYRRLPRLVREQMVESASAETVDTKRPKTRGDGWMEVELGEYFVEGGEGGDLEFGVMEVKHGNWKKGFVFQGIEVRPKGVFGDIHALPEGCIANVLSLTSPKDACRLSAVASTFGSASQSDVVWCRFLPSNYCDLIPGAVDDPDALLSQFRSKKDLYLYLCDNPILIDGGRKIRGKISTKMLSPGTCYVAYVVFTLKSNADGFKNNPTEAFVELTGHASQRHCVFIDSDEMVEIASAETADDTKHPKPRGDGWMELEWESILSREEKMLI
ncbi:F-box family protein [Striga asiatica]|uniref:F-box family protein n=1 Tax=Striga asiatica TaxID=4170 RepID=A0A5A7RDK7_STRAF|nr:F-box family protein [Striga asiatica]